MKMKKKGFTMVELLATIIILGLLVTIAYVSVRSILERGNDSYFTSQENMLILAGREYFADHRSELPDEIGDTSKVNLDTLINENYIDPIKDKDENDCNFDDSNVTVQKITEKDYQYYALLICDAYKTEEDKELPVITFNPNSKTSQSSIKVTMKITDNKEVASYRYVIEKDGENYKDSGYQKYEGNVTINLSGVGLYRITGYAIDSGGNTVTRQSGKYSIYKGINCGTVKFSSDNKDEYTKKDITVDIDVPDNTYRWELSEKVNNGSYKLIQSYVGNVDQSVVLNTDGKHQLKVVAYDQNGNSCTSVSDSYNIDKTPPKLTVILKKKTSSTDLGETANISSLENYTNNTLHNGWVVLRGSCSDNNGECTVSYKVTGASTNTDGYVNKTTRNINAQGTSTIEYRATDEAGNVTSRTYTVKLDRTAPTLSVVLKKKANSTDLGNSSNINSLKNYTNDTWYSGYVVLRGSCSDSNDCTVSYKVTGASSNTGGFVNNTTRNINASGTSTIVYRATDGAGNVTTKKYTVKLDRTRPTVSYNYDGDTYEKKSLKVCVTVKDSVGIDNIRFRIYKSGKEIQDINRTSVNATSKQECYTLSGYGSYTVYVKAYDYANNKQSKSPENDYGYYYQKYTLTNPDPDPNFKLTCKKTCNSGNCSLTGYNGYVYYNDRVWTWTISGANSGINKSKTEIRYSTNNVQNYAIYTYSTTPWGTKGDGTPLKASTNRGYAYFTNSSIKFSRSYANLSIVGTVCTKSGKCKTCTLTQ